MPDTDRELLEKAATAIGLPEPDGWHHHAGAVWLKRADGVHRETRWNPLTDDGDEARLENALGLDVEWTLIDEPEYASVAVFLRGPDGRIHEYERIADHNGDRGAARRRAGVRAAAAMAPKSDARDPGVQL